MKISLDDLFKKNPCEKGLYLFNKLKIQDIDFDNIKEIEVYTNNNYLYLQWLCKKFNLSLTIIYNKNKYIYKLGLPTHYEDSTGFTKDWKYNKNNELIDISIFNYNFIEDELKYEIK